MAATATEPIYLLDTVVPSHWISMQMDSLLEEDGRSQLVDNVLFNALRCLDVDRFLFMLQDSLVEETLLNLGDR